MMTFYKMKINKIVLIGVYQILIIVMSISKLITLINPVSISNWFGLVYLVGLYLYLRSSFFIIVMMTYEVSDKNDKNRKYIKSISKVYFFLGFQTKKYIFTPQKIYFLENIGKFEYTNFPQIVY